MKRSFMFILFMVLFQVISCTQTHDEDTSPTATEIKIGIRRFPDSLNPYISMNQEAEIIQKRLFPSLFTETKPARLEPNILESYQWGDTKTTLTMTLKPGLVWSDGTPLTMYDVDYTFRVQKDPETGWIGIETKRLIQGWEVISNLVLKVVFKDNCHTNLLDLNEGLILPKHFFSKRPFSEWNLMDWQRDGVVYGPYMVHEVLANEKIILKPLKDGPPKLGFAVIREKEMHFQLLKEGKLDYSWTLPVARFEEIQRVLNPAVFRGKTISFLAWNSIDPDAINVEEFTSREQLDAWKEKHAHPIFGSREVRRALSLALNLKMLRDTVLPARTEIPASPWALFSQELNSVEPEQNTIEADRLLTRAGWNLVDGVRVKDGNKMEFDVIVNSGNLLREHVLLSLKEDLKTIGVQMNIKALEGSLYVQACFSRKFDVIFNVLRTGTHPDLRELFHSQAALYQGFNFPSWTSADELIEEISCQPDEGGLTALYFQAQNLFIAEQPVTLLYRGSRFGAFARTGVTGTPTELDPLFKVESWQGVKSQ